LTYHALNVCIFTPWYLLYLRVLSFQVCTDTDLGILHLILTTEFSLDSLLKRTSQH
jgi:hypothetical protein